MGRYGYCLPTYDLIPISSALNRQVLRLFILVCPLNSCNNISTQRFLHIQYFRDQICVYGLVAQLKRQCSVFERSLGMRILPYTIL